MRDQWEYTTQLKVLISSVSDDNKMTTGLVKTHGYLIFVNEVMEEHSKNDSHSEKTVLRLDHETQTSNPLLLLILVVYF